MKELNLYKIRDFALNSRRRVYSIIELSKLINKPYNITKVYANRLVSEGLATKIIQGKIAFTENNLIIGTQLLEPSYISYHFSLNFYGCIRQIPFKMILITTQRPRKISEYTYKHIIPDLFFGYNREKYDDAYIFIAQPEKAILDMIYFDRAPYELFDDILNKLNQVKLKKYINKYKKIKNNRAKLVVKFGEYYDRQKRVRPNIKIK